MTNAKEGHEKTPYRNSSIRYGDRNVQCWCDLFVCLEKEKDPVYSHRGRGNYCHERNNPYTKSTKLPWEHVAKDDKANMPLVMMQNSRAYHGKPNNREPQEFFGPRKRAFENISHYNMNNGDKEHNRTNRHSNREKPFHARITKRTIFFFRHTNHSFSPKTFENWMGEVSPIQ